MPLYTVVKECSQSQVVVLPYRYQKVDICATILCQSSEALGRHICVGALLAVARSLPSGPILWEVGSLSRHAEIGASVLVREWDVLQRRALASSRAVTQYAASSALHRRPLGRVKRFLSFGRSIGGLCRPNESIRRRPTEVYLRCYRCCISTVYNLKASSRCLCA